MMTETDVLDGIRPANAPDDDRAVTISEAAVKRIQALREKQGQDDLKLRLQVNGGGCSGFSYEFSIAESLEDDDRIFEREGVQVLIDDASLDLLNGSGIDYKQDLMGAMFVVDNPNATSSCGCGTSFSIF